MTKLIKCERGGYCKIDDDRTTCQFCGKIIVKLIKRTYRITTEQDKKVKTSAKKNKESESSIIRKSIEKYVEN